MSSSNSHNSPYAPVALRNEPWWQVGRRAAQRGLVRADGSNDGIAIELEVARTFHGLGEPMLRRTPDKQARDAHKLFAGSGEWLVPIGLYELHGRQIFDLSSGLVDMLHQTDVRDCSLENLQLPYPAFYMRFGRQPGPGITGPTGEQDYIDGVLVALVRNTAGQVLHLAATTVDEAGARVTGPGYYLDLRDDELQLPVHSAVDAAMKRFIGTEIEAMPECPWVPAFWAEERERANAAMLAVMPLIVNGLFYLENPPRPHRVALGAATPPEVVAQWERTSPERRRKLQSKLVADGYTLVHLVGDEIAHQADGSGSGTVSPHWRRGHWREQPYGERLSLRKRILIKPTLVNARDVSDPLQVQGHVYKPSRGSGPSPLA